jgi:hypothetical protein
LGFRGPSLLTGRSKLDASGKRDPERFIGNRNVDIQIEHLNPATTLDERERETLRDR